MATAAPSAVAATGESGGPTTTPATPSGETQAQPRRIAPIPPKAKAGASGGGERTADPGPDPVVHKEPAPEREPERRQKPSLPGVVDSGDAPELPVRGPDGRFISQAEAARLFNDELEDDGVDIEGEEPPPDKRQTAPEPPKKPSLPGQAGKVTFLGKEYESIAHVEQMYRSLQGMHDPIARKLAQAEQDRDFGYEAANRWESEAKAARAELEQLRKTGRAPESPAAAPGQADGGLNLDAMVDGINYDAFEAIAHDPQGGTRVAGRYLASQILNTVASQIVPALKAELMKEVAPVRDVVQRQTADAATATRVTQVINEVADYKTLTGEPAFPELYDAETLVEVANTWRESGLPPAAAMTHQGLINAIGLYRLMKSLPDGIQPAAPADTETVPGPEIAALAEGADGAHTGLGRPPDQSHFTPEVRALRKSLDEAPLFDRTLGFAVNRRR